MAVSRWSRLSTLVGSWLLYWLVLGAVKLTPAIAAIIDATSGPSGAGGTVKASFGDGRVALEVIKQGATTYNGSIGQLPLALLIGVPPLIFWGIWMRLRR